TPRDENMKYIADVMDRQRSDQYPNYQTFIDEINEQFQLMGDIRTERWNGAGEPYKNSSEMVKDVESGHLWYLPTEPSSFTTGLVKHPLLEPTKLKDSKGNPLLANDVFRIVHDYFG